MTGKILISKTERKVYEYMVLQNEDLEQSKIIKHFLIEYNTFESASAAIGKILQRLKIFELIERVPTDTEKYHKRANIWKVIKPNGRIQ